MNQEAGSSIILGILFEKMVHGMSMCLKVGWHVLTKDVVLKLYVHIKFMSCLIDK